MKPITLTPDKSGYIFIIIVLLVCTGYGVWISLKVNFLWGLLVALVSVLSAATFVWWRKHQRGPQLIIDDDGIHDLRYGAGFIPWTEIEDGYIRFFKYQPILCLVLRNPEPYVQRFNFIKRRTAKWDKLIGFTSVSITLFGLTGAKPEEIVAAIKTHTEFKNTSNP